MSISRTFVRKIDLEATANPLFRGAGALAHAASRMQGSGGAMEAAMKPGCLWEKASTGMKVAVGGGLAVALGSVALAFVGPAKLMTTYLIASGVSSVVAAGAYYKLASDNEGTCGDGSTITPLNGECEGAVAKLPQNFKTQVKAVTDAISAANLPATKSFAEAQRTALVGLLKQNGYYDAASCVDLFQSA